MSEWKTIERAPKSTVTEKEVVVDGKTRVHKVIHPVYILAETSDGNVLKTHWLPQDDRWALFTKDCPPEWWTEIPVRNSNGSPPEVSKRKLYEFHWDCGRNGDLEGMFLADSEALEKLIGKEIYFGEVLGKHSDIYGELSRHDLTIVSEDPKFIETFEKVMGADFCVGYNPLNYYHGE